MQNWIENDEPLIASPIPLRGDFFSISFNWMSTNSKKIREYYIKQDYISLD